MTAATIASQSSHFRSLELAWITAYRSGQMVVCGEIDANDEPVYIVTTPRIAGYLVRNGHEWAPKVDLDGYYL